MWLCVGCLSVRNSSVDVLVLRGKIQRKMQTCPRRTNVGDRNRVCGVQKADRHYLVRILWPSATRACSVGQNINLCRKKFVWTLRNDRVCFIWLQVCESRCTQAGAVWVVCSEQQAVCTRARAFLQVLCQPRLGEMCTDIPISNSPKTPGLLSSMICKAKIKVQSYLSF